jgi:hypothetical protein
MLVFKVQTPVNHPEESAQHSEHGESLKSRKTVLTFNTLGTGDADLHFYRVLQSFGSYVTNARRVMQICVFTRGWIPRTLHLITQYMEPFFK